MPAPERIVSLLPSATEIVCALGLQVRLVGRSHECDAPSGLAELPVLTAPRFQPPGSSAEIHESVMATLRESLSVYTVDTQLLASLQPDLVVTQTQCEVCAVSFDAVQQAVQEAVGGRATVATQSASDLQGILDDIHRIAAAADCATAGDSLVRRLNARIERVRQKAAAQSARPRVALLEWLEPLMGAGNWMPELVELAGGTNCFGQVGAHAPWLQWEELVAADPDQLILLPCGYTLEQTHQDMPYLTRRPEWAELKAVRNNQVFIADGNQYFNRPGPRIVESLEILAEILHPHSFGDRHAGQGWTGWAAEA
jgi:iron complex transport system substrate-binding protein